MRTRTNVGWGRKSPTQRGNTILFGICLWRLRDGIKIAIVFWRWNIIKYIWKYSQPSVKAPEEEDPTVLTEKPTGKIYDVEDMDKEPEPIKLIEPEDM